jgi:adhesin/invasin
VLFAGSTNVTVVAEGTGPATTAEITLSYVGPGTNVESLTVTPRDTTLTFTESLAFRVTAVGPDRADIPEFFVTWSTSDPSLAISSAGVLQAPAARGQAWVRARAPNGIIDSTRVFFAPKPTTVSIVSGNAQTGAVGQALRQPLRVVVRAADNLGVRGAAVRFRGVDGGTVGDTLQFTDADGVAETIATLGNQAGPQRFEASVATLDPIQFDETAEAGSATQLTAVDGNNQTGTVNRQLATPLTVRLTDAYGNPTAGAAIDWTIDTGGGSLSSSSTVTGANGQASVTYKLSTTAGPNTVHATLHSNPQLSTTFNAVGQAGTAVTLLLVSGNGQSGTSGSPLSLPLVVSARDSFSNRVSQATVNWQIVDGAGILNPSMSTTDANGSAQAILTLGPSGTITVRATLAGTTSTVTFTETSVAGPAANIAIFSGNNQVAPQSGDTLPEPLVVLITDSFGNPVAGAEVVWDNSVGSFQQPNPSISDTKGHASTNFYFGPMGVQTVRATLSGTGKFVIFTVTGI